ncbi:hypothetical protein RHMOL_Rhmol10G0046200 [Rhododendron molle]|uniref:Uncharacterized protein n=1 Tax=Rhododendron molle TaxID=49168 RepID=A0ACC0LZX1_RHOML|nr:hypothetical protein RHMOL_Rhmol10G0046200 [Rhododendron molle]
MEAGIHSAGSSEGIQIEYIAVFVAVLFPGALVAFNYEVLQALPRFATLRIYCAGIWHNAAVVLCSLWIDTVPPAIDPVLDVPSSSPLSGFLTSGDLVMSMDGITIHNPQEWMEVAAHIHEQTLRNSNFSNSFDFTMANGNKGYCVPSSLMEGSTDVLLTDDQSTCPNEFTAFATLSCSNSSMLDDGSITDKYQNSREGMHCLIAKDIVKLRKCGDGWVKSASNRSSCPCSERKIALRPRESLGSRYFRIEEYAREKYLRKRRLPRNLHWSRGKTKYTPKWPQQRETVGWSYRSLDANNKFKEAMLKKPPGFHLGLKVGFKKDSAENARSPRVATLLLRELENYLWLGTEEAPQEFEPSRGKAPAGG